MPLQALQKQTIFFSNGSFLENLELLDELVTSAHFTEDSVLREQNIIQQEREMYQDDPDSCLFFSTLANLYPSTPLATDIVGSEESISQINLTNLQRKFYKVLQTCKHVSVFSW